DKIGRIGFRETEVGGAPAEYNLQVFAVGPSELAQSLYENHCLRLRHWFARSAAHEHPDALGLLCARRQGPSGCACEQTDKIPPAHGESSALANTASYRSAIYHVSFFAVPELSPLPFAKGDCVEGGARGLHRAPNYF